MVRSLEGEGAQQAQEERTACTCGLGLYSEYRTRIIAGQWELIMKMPGDAVEQRKRAVVLERISIRRFSFC